MLLASSDVSDQIKLHSPKLAAIHLRRRPAVPRITYDHIIIITDHMKYF